MLWRNLQFIPEQASELATEMDPLFFVISALTAFFTILVATVLLFFAIRYRRGNKVDRSRPVHHSLPLELFWSIIPLIMALGVFAWGAVIFAKVKRPPDNAREIFVMGKRWMWHIQHLNGIRENNALHLPIGEPVKVTMISQDVIHDFFVPAFRIHQDVIPGHYTTTWFTPTKIGEYHLLCSQYCGTKHSEMVGKVFVLSKEDFAEWERTGGEKVVKQRLTMEQRGEELYNQLACGSCHTNTDTRKGPSLIGIYNMPRPLASGGTTTADNNYLRRALLNPNADVTAGYQVKGAIGSTMPEYKQLTEEQVHQLIAYMRSLSGSQVLQGTTTNSTTSPTGAQPSSGQGATGNTRGGNNGVNNRQAR